jgi:hypothetical protein
MAPRSRAPCSMRTISIRPSAPDKKSHSGQRESSEVLAEFAACAAYVRIACQAMETLIKPAAL